MRLGDLRAASGKLKQALDLLRLRWEQTSEVWNDSQRFEFEEHHLVELQHESRKAIDSMNRLAELVVQAQRECGEEG